MGMTTMLLLVQQALHGHRSDYLAGPPFRPLTNLAHILLDSLLMNLPHILLNYLLMNLAPVVSQIVVKAIHIINGLPKILVPIQIMMIMSAIIVLRVIIMAFHIGQGIASIRTGSLVNHTICLNLDRKPCPTGRDNTLLGTTAASTEETSPSVMRMSIITMITRHIFSEFFAPGHSFYFISILFCSVLSNLNLFAVFNMNL